ncbi:uncharacterized protein LOC130049477 isoform X2 [Ostrea edulis]|uniref:uncharacterized protein LOC125671946 isoform X2 n=1 Tax=Ostrea edulis TaxID=37623 RepID=UPI0024AE898E|nr:uncharacterized protein LOC125671946 isoform X2 [Ostrea edulis]XP_056003179.1 uncharacterized protein LOC130049477 isoform X2 [Ostrea edulis]
MVRGYAVLSAMFVSFMFLQNDAKLPKFVNRVSKCPEPGDITKWERRSEELECHHPLQGGSSQQQSHVYHCLPSSYLNESVEYCGISGPVDAGNCPVYKYANTNGRNKAVSYRQCRHFTTGCPDEFYHSKEVYKYPSCLNLNEVSKCYLNDIACPTKDNVSIVTMSSTENTTTLVIDARDVTGPHVNKSDFDSDSVITLLIVLLVVLSAIVIGGTVGFFRKRENVTGAMRFIRSKIRCLRKVQLSSTDPNSSIPMLNAGGEGDGAATCTCTSNGGLIPVYKEMNVLKAAHLKDLIYRVATGIADTNIKRLIFNLKNDVIGNSDRMLARELDEITDGEQLLLFMHRMFDLNLNLCILQGYLELIDEHKLAQECKHFAKRSKEPLSFYRKHTNRKGVTTVYVKLAKDRSECTLNDIENVARNIAHLVNAKRKDVRIRGISEGCVLLHLDVTNRFISTLKRCNFNCLKQFGVFRIEISDKCIFHCDNHHEDAMPQDKYSSKRKRHTRKWRYTSPQRQNTQPKNGEKNRSCKRMHN